MSVLWQRVSYVEINGRHVDDESRTMIGKDESEWERWIAI